MPSVLGGLRAGEFWRAGAAVAGAILLISVSGTPASAGTVPAGFQETTAFSGLTNPTVVKFAPDGKVYVAEKSGLIKVFDGLGDSTPTVWADLRTKVHNFWDRGLLGMTLDIYYDRAIPASTSSTRMTRRSAVRLRDGAAPARPPTAAQVRPARPATAALSAGDSRS